MFEAPTQDRLLELIDAMQAQPVVLIADLVADRFIHGAPKRISREAPVLILSYEGETVVPGGGANAVANVRSLGGRPITIGTVGRDRDGEALLEALEERQIDTDGIDQLEGHRTTTKTRILAGGRHAIKQQIVRYDIESSRLLDDETLRQQAARLRPWKDRARVALLSDYGYGSVPPGWIPALRDELGDQVQLIADSRYRLGSFRGLDSATPNEEEAEALLGAPLGESLTEAAASARILRESIEAASLLITRGSSGMLLTTPAGCAALPVHGTDQVADVTGAGDTVIGTFGLALAAGATPLEAALLANYAGGIVVMKVGTATLQPDELRQSVVADPRPLEALQWATY